MQGKACTYGSGRLQLRKAAAVAGTVVHRLVSGGRMSWLANTSVRVRRWSSVLCTTTIESVCTKHKHKSNKRAEQELQS